jgi:hypothetical protein
MVGTGGLNKGNVRLSERRRFLAYCRPVWFCWVSYAHYRAMRAEKYRVSRQYYYLKCLKKCVSSWRKSVFLLMRERVFREKKIENFQGPPTSFIRGKDTLLEHTNSIIHLPFEDVVLMAKRPRPMDSSDNCVD